MNWKLIHPRIRPPKDAPSFRLFCYGQFYDCLYNDPEPSGFAALPHWGKHNPLPALEAFVRGCETWSEADDSAMLNPNLPQYGTFGDWRVTCQGASVLLSVDPREDDVRQFFESWFKPVSLMTRGSKEGLLTGYYEPEVEVRLKADSEFSEPI